MSQLKALAVKYDNLVQREKLLVIAVVLTVVYMLWSLLFMSSIDATVKKLEVNLSIEQKAMSQFSQQLKDLQNLEGRDPDAALRQKSASLSAKIKAIDDQLGAASVGLVAAKELPNILETVLLKTKALQLVSLQTLPTQELTFVNLEADYSVEQSAGVYKHSAQLIVTGNYFALHEYLKSLENLPWKFYWDSLDYEVVGYPQALIKLQVYTLSTERGAVGG